MTLKLFVELTLKLLVLFLVVKSFQLILLPLALKVNGDFAKVLLLFEQGRVDLIDLLPEN